MIGEIAAIVSALRGVQSLLNNISEAKASYDQAAQLLGKLGSAQETLDAREKRLKGKRPLTSKEALQIVQKQAEIDQARQKVRDHLLMSGPADMIHKQESLLRASRVQHQEWMKGVARRRRIRRQRWQGIAIGFFLVFSLITIAIGGYYMREVYLIHKLKTAKELLQERRERTRNYRECGRAKC